MLHTHSRRQILITYSLGEIVLGTLLILSDIAVIVLIYACINTH